MKTGRANRKLAFLTGVLLFLGVVCGATSALASLFPADPMDKVGFWLQDGNGDQKLSLSVVSFDQGYHLEYKTLTDDLWKGVSLFNPIREDKERELFYFSLFDGTNRVESGTVHFSDYFNKVLINWDLGVACTIAFGPDDVSAVPIPSALFLFIPGVIAFLGIRRRKNFHQTV